MWEQRTCPKRENPLSCPAYRRRSDGKDSKYEFLTGEVTSSFQGEFTRNMNKRGHEYGGKPQVKIPGCTRRKSIVVPDEHSVAVGMYGCTSRFIAKAIILSRRRGVIELHEAIPKFKLDPAIINGVQRHSESSMTQRGLSPVPSHLEQSPMLARDNSTKL